MCIKGALSGRQESFTVLHAIMPPKTSSERVKAFRKRLKEDPVASDAGQKHDRERKKVARLRQKATITEEEKEAIRKKERERKRLQRDKKKNAILAEKRGGPCPYSNTKTLGKAISRAKRALLLTPRRQIHVNGSIIVSLPKDNQSILQDVVRDVVRNRVRRNIIHSDRKTHCDTIP